MTRVAMVALAALAFAGAGVVAGVTTSQAAQSTVAADPDDWHWRPGTHVASTN